MVSALLRSREIAVLKLGWYIYDLRRILAVIVWPLLFTILGGQATTLFKSWIGLVNETCRLQFLLVLYRWLL